MTNLEDRGFVYSRHDPGLGSNFVSWVLGRTDTLTKLNCWEFVMVWAVENGRLSKDHLKEILRPKPDVCDPTSYDAVRSLFLRTYVDTTPEERRSSSGALRKRESLTIPYNQAETTLRAGDLIFILSPNQEDSISHAVVSLGGDEILGMYENGVEVTTFTAWLRKFPGHSKEWTRVYKWTK